MTKRERQALARRLAKLTAKIGVKRDELRALVDELQPIVESVSDGIDEMATADYHLKQAFARLDGAADTISRYV